MEPAKVIPFELPKKPRIKEKEPLPDQRKVVVLPFKAVFDKRLTHGALQALAALCAYCNRAGITWVSQKRLAEELEISQQAYSKQFRQLVKYGYVEVVKKSYMGQRSSTTRVIYDPSITAEDAHRNGVIQRGLKTTLDERGAKKRDGTTKDRPRRSKKNR